MTILFFIFLRNYLYFLLSPKAILQLESPESAQLMYNFLKQNPQNISDHVLTCTLSPKMDISMVRCHYINFCASIKWRKLEGHSLKARRCTMVVIFKNLFLDSNQTGTEFRHFFYLKICFTITFNFYVLWNSINLRINGGNFEKCSINLILHIRYSDSIYVTWLSLECRETTLYLL